MTEVHTIDLNFQDTPGVIASYVFDTGDGLAVVDTGPTSTLPALEEGLHAFGAELRDLRHLLLTHIHFDHAGAAGTLLERLPKAKVYVHERGAPTLPARKSWWRVPRRFTATRWTGYGARCGPSTPTA